MSHSGVMSDALSEVFPGPFPQPCACALFCTEHPVLHSTELGSSMFSVSPGTVAGWRLY